MPVRRKLDCIRMKREGARLVYEQIKDLSIEQELEFWKKRGKALDRRVKAAKARGHAERPRAA